jgi:hypothetical protein
MYGVGYATGMAWVWLAYSASGAVRKTEMNLFVQAVQIN